MIARKATTKSEIQILRRLRKSKDKSPYALRIDRFLVYPSEFYNTKRVGTISASAIQRDVAAFRKAEDAVGLADGSVAAVAPVVGRSTVLACRRKLIAPSWTVALPSTKRKSSIYCANFVSHWSDTIEQSCCTHLVRCRGSSAFYLKTMCTTASVNFTRLSQMMHTLQTVSTGCVSKIVPVNDKDDEPR